MRLWIALLGCTLLLSVTHQTSASSCVSSTLAQRLARADVVFVAEAGDIDQDLATTLQVERVYKGVVPPRVVVHTDRNKYAMLPPPSRFLVFARIRASSGDAGERELYVETCGGSKEISEAAGDLAHLGKGVPPSHKAAKIPEAAAKMTAPAGEQANPDAGADAISGDADGADEPAPVNSTSTADASGGAASAAPVAQPPPAPPNAGCAGCTLGRSSRETRPELAWMSAALASGALRRRGRPRGACRFASTR